MNVELHYCMIKYNPKQDNYIPHSSANLRSYCEPGSNSQSLGHEPSIVTQSHPAPDTQMM